MAKPLAVKNLPFKHGEIVEIKIIALNKQKVIFQDKIGNKFRINKPLQSDWDGVSPGDEGKAFMRRYISAGNEYGQLILF